MRTYSHPIGDPYEYTVAGSPVAVSRYDDSDTIYVNPLPGTDSLDDCLSVITLDAAEHLIRSLRAALDLEEN